jgi:hypothetical protein
MFNDIVMVDGKDRLTLANGEQELNLTFTLPVSDSPTDILSPSNYDVKVTVIHKDEPTVLKNTVQVPTEYKLIKWGIPAAAIILFASLVLFAYAYDTIKRSAARRH